ncbi:hypothetical protein [Micromonospora sp. CPCC 205558]|uniref:hypothetical protein n=1 Tax=Micromonospora sp. CPCC 205558 TaxID=3122403 RepID=UPI002FF04287
MSTSHEMEEQMPRSPENKESPNASETKPRKEVSDRTKSALGSAAIKGAQGSK